MVPQGPASGSNYSKISYRPVQLSDLEALLQLHNDVFPTRCESESFQNAVIGHNAFSWVAVDHNRGDGKDDRVIGFVSAHMLPAKESEVADSLISGSSDPQQSVIFILMLGVTETYRKLGIATRLLHEVLKHASKTPICCAVYLHVASYNIPAIQLYKKLSFKCLRTLRDYYDTNGQHDDAYLFVYFPPHRKFQETSSRTAKILSSGVSADLYNAAEGRHEIQQEYQQACFRIAS
ncbi:histone acetyltransferase MCC1-like isoform X1 [Punica granatum]|uniref:N-alpha-acetyltransferase 60 n=1 Tax=Punica granatum TaxID=22663 RepID=A0A6P8CB10_PUNGR|nr:histone acetyltransferase MCC1-like isoform X1 [Punica granatum]XP_031380144.1 histone acetyltransferase MCC1-like isoform X1 [Punica granatum]XP_031380145.1 histone acetyltransferase MCC1-like isoform X1 [Punica granatum]XP_031380146.1 histone acetyltransferase MCC1-like isoform X1 [Punica granatum]XP_031380147.1 histone acetyltransferase MCC1-like isoform X1 [Punica granatum]XP_031380148.1 histone acetyltransferase MCC1-like isoform X1 [Punica granatum]XP_031380149.1 histone acetyltransf